VEISLSELEVGKYIKNVTVKRRHQIQYNFPFVLLRFQLISTDKFDQNM